MALHGFDQFKKSQQQDTETYTFTVTPLYCGGCLTRIINAFDRNGIMATCIVSRYGEKDGNQAGDLQVSVEGGISRDRLVEVMTRKMGLKLSEPAVKKGYGM